jgi:hypothetical protein
MKIGNISGEQKIELQTTGATNIFSTLDSSYERGIK